MSEPRASRGEVLMNVAEAVEAAIGHFQVTETVDASGGPAGRARDLPICDHCVEGEGQWPCVGALGVAAELVAAFEYDLQNIYLDGFNAGIEHERDKRWEKD